MGIFIWSCFTLSAVCLLIAYIKTRRDKKKWRAMYVRGEGGGAYVGGSGLAVSGNSISMKMSGAQIVAVTPDATARAFGLMLHREYGNDASRLADLVVSSVQDAMRGIDDDSIDMLY